MDVVILDTAAAAAEFAYCRLADLLGRTPRAHVCLATGKTFQPVYRRISESVAAGALDTASALFTHLDEYLDIAPEAPGTMAAELRAVLFDAVPAGSMRLRPVPAADPDPAAAHRAQIESLPPPDLLLLGIGRNGHIAFNEPGSPFRRISHAVELAGDTIAANRDRFPGPAPSRAVTMGIEGILRARRILLLATGESKAEAVARMLLSPLDEGCPATALRLHDRVAVVLDAAAATGYLARRPPPPAPAAPAVLAGPLDPGGPVLVVSPHPDDASISCGGLLLSLHPRGDRIILVMTTGARAPVAGLQRPEDVAALREAEVLKEASILGCGARFLRGRFYDSGFYEPRDVAMTLRHLQEIRPGWILAPSRADPHPTHRMSRIILDEALSLYLSETGSPVELWTFEGPWFQHPAEEINAAVAFSGIEEALKVQAVLAHRSQVERVPFHEGAKALARLRAVSLSESLLDGRRSGPLPRPALVEAYRREVLRPQRPSAS